MRVYITRIGVDYEGSNVDRVYLKRRNANKRLKEITEYGDWQDVVSIKVEDAL